MPARNVEGTFKLGEWVSGQRHRRDTISVERRKRLDAIGFVWDALEAAWEEGFAALRKFKNREGHCRVPTTYVEGKYRLGSWVSKQRRAKDTMPAERRKRLDKIGFVWRQK